MVDRSFTIDTPGGTIGAWRGEGTAGPVAVLLHGGPGMSASYLDPLTDLLGDVFRTVSYQQRGLPPTTIRAPYTVEANVADAVAVIDQVAGERAWIVGHSWGGHLALHLLATCPERLEGAIILDPLGAYLEVFEEFGHNMTAPLSDAQRARAEELDAKEERGEASPEESKEAFGLVWPSYFADPAAAPPCPDLAFDVATLAGTFASVREHERAGTLTRRLPDVPSSTPVLFVHGARSPMPVRTTTMTAELIPHARVEILPDAGHFLWHEDPTGTHDAIARFVADARLHRRADIHALRERGRHVGIGDRPGHVAVRLTRVAVWQRLRQPRGDRAHAACSRPRHQPDRHRRDLRPGPIGADRGCSHRRPAATRSSWRQSCFRRCHCPRWSGNGDGPARGGSASAGSTSTSCTPPTP